MTSTLIMIYRRIIHVLFCSKEKWAQICLLACVLIGKYRWYFVFFSVSIVSFYKTAITRFWPLLLERTLSRCNISSICIQMCSHVFISRFCQRIPVDIIYWKVSEIIIIAPSPPSLLSDIIGTLSDIAKYSES